jgi:hypothetical protein
MGMLGIEGILSSRGLEEHFFPGFGTNATTKECKTTIPGDGSNQTCQRATPGHVMMIDAFSKSDRFTPKCTKN